MPEHAVDVPTALSRWHALVDAADLGRLPDLVAADATFRSPAVHTPQQGREVTVAYLTAALHVLGPRLAYHREWPGEDSAVLEFTTEVAGMSVHGADFITWDEAGLITDFTVMIRPVKGLHAVIEAMTAQLT